MHRPLGRAALVVSAPFRLAAARLHCLARSALANLPPGSAAGQAWSPALQCVAPLACPAKRGNCLQDRRARASALRASAPCAAYPFGSSALRLRSNWRARGSSAFGVFGLPALANLASPSGRCQLISYAAVVLPPRQKPARLLVMRRDLHSVVPFQQIIAS